MEELTSTEYNTILKTLQQEASVLTEHVLENVEGDPKTGKLLLKNLWTLRKTLSKQEEAADTEPVSPEELLSSLDA